MLESASRASGAAYHGRCGTMPTRADTAGDAAIIYCADIRCSAPSFGVKFHEKPIYLAFQFTRGLERATLIADDAGVEHAVPSKPASSSQANAWGLPVGFASLKGHRFILRIDARRDERVYDNAERI